MRKCRSSNPLLFESLIYKHYLAIKVRIYLIVLCFNGFIGIMKKHERVTLHREKLYQEVWQTPISQLASKYGLSDVGLAKVCKRMDIPLPPRGYWQKRRYGHEVKESNLPAARKHQAQAETQINKSEEDLLHIARNKQSKGKLGHVERQRVFRLQAALKNWESSNRIRAFIAAMRASPAAGKEDFASFLAWADTYANHLDPTNEFRIEVLDDA